MDTRDGKATLIEIGDFVCRYARPTPAAERERSLARAPFGSVFTDHMVMLRWSAERRWHDAQLQPYAPLTLAPSAQVFHYGQAVFEGLKAYRGPAGEILLFRPQMNARRLNRSCERMGMPTLPEETFLEALSLLVRTDRDWVPHAEGHSLYLRPFMIATQPGLSFYGRAQEFMFLVIACPAGAYFQGGVKPITVWLSTEYVRSAPGGTGAAKCSGNYGGTVVAQEQAAGMGCDQVIWLDAVERRWLEEMGTSNLFCVFGSRLVTPRLSGTVLAGVTRDSLLQLAAELGYEAGEDDVGVDRLQAAARSGELTELFSAGTSSMVTPIGRVKGVECDFAVGDGQPGPVTMRLRKELMDIQYGLCADRHGWRYRLT